jgi:hypothetical protein
MKTYDVTFCLKDDDNCCVGTVVESTAPRLAIKKARRALKLIRGWRTVRVESIGVDGMRHRWDMMGWKY